MLNNGRDLLKKSKLYHLKNTRFPIFMTEESLSCIINKIVKALKNLKVQVLSLNV